MAELRRETNILDVLFDSDPFGSWMSLGFKELILTASQPPAIGKARMPDDV